MTTAVVAAHLGHVLTKPGLCDRAAATVYTFDTGRPDRVAWL
jgi:hypothetical protein